MPKGNSYDAILKQAGDSKGIVFKFSKTYPAYILLAIFLALSFLVYQFFNNKVSQDSKNTFDKATSSVMARLDKKQEVNTEIMRSLQGIFNSMEQVVRDYFTLYGEVPTKAYPSLLSMIYVQRTPTETMPLTDDFLYYAQRTVFYDYAIKPAGKREEYAPILYIVPQIKHQHMLGKDFLVNPMLREIMAKSRDNNMMVTTPVFTMRDPDTVGFYYMCPVYKHGKPIETLEDKRKNYEGMVLLEIDHKMFFTEAIAGGSPTDSSIVFEIYDKDASNKETCVFRSKNADQYKADYKPEHQYPLSFKLADRTMEIRFRSVPDFSTSFQRMLPLLALGISVVLSFAFFGFILSVTTSKARAVDIAERITRSQRRIVDSSKDIIAVLDPSGTWKSMNPACYGIFGIDAAEMIGQSINGLFENESDLAAYNEKAAQAADEETIRVDYRMKTSTGEIKWINWSFTVSKTDSLIYAIGRDVTLEKLAEEQARLRSKQIQLAEQITREASEFKSFFMTKLSHQLRNSLTGIIGYLQLLSNQIYDTDEERDSYVSMAEESSEELFAFISDIDDVSGASDESKRELATIPFEKVLASATGDMKKAYDNRKVQIQMMEEGTSAKVISDFGLLQTALVEVFAALSGCKDETQIQISASENPYEGATEVQILTDANPAVTDLIDVYRKHTNNLVDALSLDSDDVLLHFATAASCFRMLNGTMTVETFGAEEGNIVQITLPLNKVQSE